MIAISAIAMIGALGLIAYPTFSDWWNRMHQSYAVAGYVEQTKDMSGAERKAMLKAAHEYNERLAANGDRWHMTDAQKREIKSSFLWGRKSGCWISRAKEPNLFYAERVA